MKTLVIYDGRRIVVEHKLDSLALIIDGVKYDEVNGVVNTNKDNVLNAVINCEDGSEDKVRVEYIDAKMVKLTGKLVFYYNDVLIAEKRTF